jgi:hypothetical protein
MKKNLLEILNKAAKNAEQSIKKSEQQKKNTEEIYNDEFATPEENKLYNELYQSLYDKDEAELKKRLTEFKCGWWFFNLFTFNGVYYYPVFNKDIYDYPSVAWEPIKKWSPPKLF